MRSQVVGGGFAEVRLLCTCGGEYRLTNSIGLKVDHLRHAAISLWLNSGVPATQVPEWAGHSVHVLLKVYAKCIDGQGEVARRRVEAALKLGDGD